MSADNKTWTDFSNNGFASNGAGAIPAAAAYLRGMSISAAGTFDYLPLTDHGMPVTQAVVTAGSQSAATANTAAIQALLNAGGMVQVLAAGVVYINSTLTLGNYTGLYPGPPMKMSWLAVRSTSVPAALAAVGTINSRTV